MEGRTTASGNRTWVKQMRGEQNLQQLLRTLKATLHDGVYVFVTMTNRPVPSSVSARMVFEEAEGKTLILLREEAERSGLECEFPCRMITLDVHSALDAVGFIAYIATRLAEENMGVNPVAGFFHDHLFVPEGREEDAMRVLQSIAQNAQNAEL